jgi:hypothetical protein
VIIKFKLLAILMPRLKGRRKHGKTAAIFGELMFDDVNLATCLKCGLSHGFDFNAAINMQKGARSSVGIEKFAPLRWAFFL